MGTVPSSSVPNAPRVILEAVLVDRTFRYVHLPSRTTPQCVVEMLSSDALGKECWIRVSPGNRDEYALAMACLVDHLADMRERDQ